MSRRKLSPIHPGEVLLEEFLAPMGTSQYRLAKDIGVPRRRINEVVRGQRSITADTALRLARYFPSRPPNVRSIVDVYASSLEGTDVNVR